MHNVMPNLEVMYDLEHTLADTIFHMQKFQKN